MRERENERDVYVEREGDRERERERERGRDIHYYTKGLQVNYYKKVMTRKLL